MRAVNLIPYEERARGVAVAGRSQGAVYGVLGLIGGLALLALLYGLAHHQISDRRSNLASLNARAQQAQAATAQLAPYTNFIALREERVRAVSSLVDSRFDWAHVFHEFGRVLPPLVTLTSLDGSVGSSSGSGSSSSSGSGSGGSSGSSASSAGSAKPAASSSVASATPPGTVPQFTVSGCAVSQAQVADVLTRLRLIDGVSEVTLQSSTRSTGGGAVAGGSGTCLGPAFTIGVTFEPLPSPGAVTAAAARPASFTGGSR
jgi:Tfp pilus assembly protein PilN